MVAAFPQKQCQISFTDNILGWCKACGKTVKPDIYATNISYAKSGATQTNDCCNFLCECPKCGNVVDIGEYK